jgi:hypothetical protein
MSSIGDEQAFPVPGMSKTTKNGTLCLTPIPGMTYRMWLIGKVLEGMNANPECSGEASEYSKCAILQADDAIAKLDAERKVPDAAE